ncbi:MAG: PHP domain-containing protein [Candidatus Micrarchaeota archaeon]|nr:PHP domain-containing protein [Candidatus Micrarchaeota archaeon]
MKKYDLHVHSKYSIDSINEPKELVKKYLKEGYSGFAITDHNSIEGYKKAKEYILEYKIEIELIGGCEYKSTKGEIIGLFIEEKIESKDFFEIVDHIHEQGGLVIIPHPFDPTKKGAINPTKLTKDELKQIDGIETFNSSCTNDKYNKEAETFATKNSFSKTAGSDAHIMIACAKAETKIAAELELYYALRKKLTVAEGRLNPMYYRGIPTIIKYLKKLSIIK